MARYDIYGPSVQIANKMESLGEKGFVVVSQSTRNLVSEGKNQRFRFERHENVQFGKGAHEWRLDSYKVKELDQKICPKN